MAVLIADTDFLIDFLAGQSPTATQIAAELEMGTLFTTAVTRFELLSGARTAAQERRIRQLLDALPTLPLDTQAADQAARIRLDLERKGTAKGRALSQGRAFRSLMPFLEEVAQVALSCAHRTSTVSPCAFCEQEGHLAAPSHSSEAARCASTEDAGRLPCSYFFSSVTTASQDSSEGGILRY